MALAKLDSYDYRVFERLFDGNKGVIRIYVESSKDPSLVDILSDINRASGKIYVEGRYYFYLDNYRLVTNNNKSYLELDVQDVS